MWAKQHYSKEYSNFWSRKRKHSTQHAHQHHIHSLDKEAQAVVVGCQQQNHLRQHYLLSRVAVTIHVAAAVVGEAVVAAMRRLLLMAGRYKRDLPAIPVHYGTPDDQQSVNQRPENLAELHAQTDCRALRRNALPPSPV